MRNFFFNKFENDLFFVINVQLDLTFLSSTTRNDCDGYVSWQIDSLGVDYVKEMLKIFSFSIIARR